MAATVETVTTLTLPKSHTTLHDYVQTDRSENVPNVQGNVNVRPSTGYVATVGYNGQLQFCKKLSFTKLPSIVSRMRRDTKSSSMKRWRWYKGDNYVDYNSWTWRNIPLLNDYQAHMWTKDGAIKKTCRK
ncbi:hypothetical protein KUTeg_022195 [Tegillarca granosa]|uniref:Uncharacterized protein n=1 Tax=Tegillarca granosa TaxID=220873 RepID=A0ABQ9E8D9_TEGGR|nr:hypothetical protein KUTeg_022195 [Tegillarca granosa]